MKIKTATFIKSSTAEKLCPEPDMPEYAFIGRSNVGKSSLINMITNNKNLAKTSSKPGKTQLINHFLINETWYMVDLPGYGYAKNSKTNRLAWSKFSKQYIMKRDNLMCLFVLIDARIKPQKNDLDFMEELGINEIPFVIAFTKTDKLSKYQLNEQINNFTNKMLESWEETPLYFITSALKKIGKKEILDYIDEISKKF